MSRCVAVRPGLEPLTSCDDLGLAINFVKVSKEQLDVWQGAFRYFESHLTSQFGSTRLIIHLRPANNIRIIC